MKLFILTLVIVAAATLTVAAVIFRSQRAFTMLRFLRRLGWAYVIAVSVMGIYYLWQGGL